MLATQAMYWQLLSPYNLYYYYYYYYMKCLQDIVGVTLWNKRRNEDILAETEEVLVEDQVKLRQLQWFGHLQRMPVHRPQR